MFLLFIHRFILDFLTGSKNEDIAFHSGLGWKRILSVTVTGMSTGRTKNGQRVPFPKDQPLTSLL